MTDKTTHMRGDPGILASAHNLAAQITINVEPHPEATTQHRSESHHCHRHHRTVADASESGHEVGETRVEVHRMSN